MLHVDVGCVTHFSLFLDECFLKRYIDFIINRMFGFVKLIEISGLKMSNWIE